MVVNIDGLLLVKVFKGYLLTIIENNKVVVLSKGLVKSSLVDSNY